MTEPTEWVMVPRDLRDALYWHLDALGEAGGDWSAESRKFADKLHAILTSPLPPAPDMEVGREWEASLVNLGPNWEGVEKAIAAGHSMAAALSAQANLADRLQRNIDELAEDFDAMRSRAETAEAEIERLKSKLQK